MFFGPLESQDWRPVRSWRASDAGLDRERAAVLTMAGSLTRFLERRHRMRLEVRLHDQYVDKTAAAEAGLLDVAPGSPALRRYVSLLHRGAVMFDAESVLPLEDLSADLVAELEAGCRPLGNLLLDRGLSLSRSDLAVTRIRGHAPYDGRWARRSVLKSPSGTRALVVEVFHDLIWDRIARATARRGL